MNALKTMLVMSLGLGVTWAAWQIAPAGSSGMLGSVRAQETPQAEPAPAPQITNEDIEAQLARLEAELDAEGELKEFVPSEPLPADLAIEMSSEL